ncbi:MAG: SDR family oxidoreductase [Actinomycetota bacterium]|nr:SDR family oxidoreductase [Actinomycetota bacterium]
MKTASRAGRAGPLRRLGATRDRHREDRRGAGSVWVVTGASSGIGRRTALDLAAAGAQVCVAARRAERLEALIEELPGTGHSYRVTDVSDRDQVRALADHVRDRYGRCHVLVNNAGGPGPETFDGPDAIAGVEATLATNFLGAVYCTGEFLPLLESSAPSHVVNVTSVAGRLAAPGVAAYTASKFALVGWTESLQPQLARRGVYLSSVEPGFIPTEGFPQKDFVDDRLLKHLLGSDAQVSAAIQDAVAGRKPQRVVPRWYYLLQVPRLLTPFAYRRVVKKLASIRQSRR